MNSWIINGLLHTKWSQSWIINEADLKRPRKEHFWWKMTFCIKNAWYFWPKLEVGQVSWDFASVTIRGCRIQRCNWFFTENGFWPILSLISHFSCYIPPKWLTLYTLNCFNGLENWNKVALPCKRQYLWRWTKTLCFCDFKTIFSCFSSLFVNFWANDFIFTTRPLHGANFIGSKVQAWWAITTLQRTQSSTFWNVRPGIAPQHLLCLARFLHSIRPAYTPMTPVKFSLDAKCLPSPSKIVLIFRNRPKWGWRRPLWALKNRKPTHAGTFPELKFTFKTSPSLPKIDLQPFKVSQFWFFRSPSRDPQIPKPSPGIDSVLKSRWYISFFQHSQTNSCCM